MGGGLALDVVVGLKPDSCLGLGWCSALTAPKLTAFRALCIFFA
jgi:hypothetical protein